MSAKCEDESQHVDQTQVARWGVLPRDERDQTRAVTSTCSSDALPLAALIDNASHFDSHQTVTAVAAYATAHGYVDV